MRLAFVLCCSVALLGAVGTADAQDWTKSKWGPNDEIGAANYMTPELVVKAASLVKTGKTYALGIPVTSQTPAYPPRTFKITVVQPGQAGSPGLGPNKATYNDDILDTWVGIGSQLDGLGHLGIEHVYYNGNKLADFADPNGLKKLGIEKVPPMVTRGVLLDVAGADGGQHLNPGRVVTPEELARAEATAKVTLEPGDIALIRTGWGRYFGIDNTRYLQGEPGIDLPGAHWLIERGVAAIGCDNMAVEVLPNPNRGISMPVHQHALAEAGVYLIENLALDELARDGVGSFCFVLLATKFRGATGSPVRPVAMV